MNKVYKVVWSKVKNAYVVASELAKSRTKAPKAGMISRTLVTGVLACVLSCGAVMPSVMAMEYFQNNSQHGPYLDYDQSFNGYYATGLQSVYSFENNNIPQDILDFVVNNSGTSSNVSSYNKILLLMNNENQFKYALLFDNPRCVVTLGADELKPLNLKSLGSGEVNGLRFSQIAGQAQSNITSIELGNGAYSPGDYSVAIGKDVKNTGENNIAIGTDVTATGSNSVILGAGSDGSQSNVISVGAETNKRRIVNVADGVADSDVATVGQLKSMSGSSIHGVGVNNITESSANYNGEGAMGVDSIAIGDAKAAGGASVAIGSGAIATGNNSIAFGTNATATGDGMTREQVNSILSNNKAIRDALNDARVGYTQSKADYDRQKEIWEGQNEAVARVNHANELIAGYQAEIDNTLQPNANTANDAYNTAKTDYDTLYNDFQHRLEEVKYIDFTVYADGSAAGYDYDRMSSDLKTKVETGTSFDMPVSFYNDYIHNYIKANGDLRLTQEAAGILSYSAATTTQNPTSEYTFTLSGSSLYLGKKYYSVNDIINASQIEKYLQRFDSNFSMNGSFKKFSSSSFVISNGGDYGDSGSGMIEYSSAVKIFNDLLKTKVFSDSERNVAYENIDSVALNNKNLNSIIANELVNINQMTSEERDVYVQFGCVKYFV